MAPGSLTPTPSAATLDDALARLVTRGVLDLGQADAVRAEVSLLAPTGREEPRRTRVRSRLVEVAAYLGAVLVAASLVAFLADSWDELSSLTRLTLLSGSGLAAYAAGLAVALTVAGGFHVLREHAHAARRRVAGALMALGAVLLGVAVVLVLEDVLTRSELAGVAVALALFVVAQVLAPSAITEIGTFGSTLALTGLGVDAVIPDVEPDWTAEVYQPPLEETVIPLALAAVGVLWGAVVARWLTLPVLAAALGSVVAVVSAVLLTTLPDEWPALVVLAVLAVLGLVLFLRAHLWPWLALTVLSVTVFVFTVVADQAAPALAFLVAGLVLLAGALGAAALGRRAAKGTGSAEAAP